MSTCTTGLPTAAMQVAALVAALPPSLQLRVDRRATMGGGIGGGDDLGQGRLIIAAPCD